MPTFDGANLVVTLDTGVTFYDADPDIYSPWKEWVQLSDNAKFPPLFRIVSSQDVPSGQTESLLFMRNDLGWRFRPPRS
jgi:hypothetical protein